jgi:hypothetical protein
MSFAALQARLNTTALARLGTVVVLAGVSVPAVFDKTYLLGHVGSAGMASSQSALTLETSVIPPQIVDWFRYYTEPFNPIDLLVNVADTDYRIVGHEPDGAGLSHLVLETV